MNNSSNTSNPTPDTLNTDISAKSIVVLIVFFLILIPVIYPIQMKYKKFKFTWNMATAPLFGVFFLFVTTCMSWNSIVLGIIGDDVIKPYSIFILFFSLAYICVSVDVTGFFEYIANLTAKSYSQSPLKMFFSFYTLTSLLTLFTSNDIVILNITPILIYFCQLKRIRVEPFLMSEFISANTWSIALYIGNPTNIIVANAYSMSFLQYSYWMALPAVVSALVSILIIFILFYKEITEPALLVELDVKPLKHRKSAYIGVGMLGLCLVALVVFSFYGVQVWQVTLPFAVLLLIKDFLMDYLYENQQKESGQMMQLKSVSIKEFNDSQNSVDSEHAPLGQETPQTLPPAEQSEIESINKKWKTLRTINERMPWLIAPFIICMFILVQALQETNWLALLSKGLFPFVQSSNVLVLTIVMSLLSSIACVILNNQPMTIVFTKLLLQPIFENGISQSRMQRSLFSVILGSNLGANLSLNGALAGLMWIQILKDKEVKGINFFWFMKYGFIITLPSILLSAIVLNAEFGGS